MKKVFYRNCCSYFCFPLPSPPAFSLASTFSSLHRASIHLHLPTAIHRHHFPQLSFPPFAMPRTSACSFRTCTKHLVREKHSYEEKRDRTIFRAIIGTPQCHLSAPTLKECRRSLDNLCTNGLRLPLWETIYHEQQFPAALYAMQAGRICCALEFRCSTRAGEFMFKGR